MIGARWAMRLIGLISVAILARLLAPADFGVVAMALVIAGLLDTAAYAGVDLALIRTNADTREYRDSAWTIQLLQGAVIAALLLLAAPFAAEYYGEPKVATILMWLSAKSMIEGFQNIGIVAFQKDLDFAKQFRFNVYSRVLNLVVTVAAAFFFRNYLALVIGMVSGALITVGLSYAMHPYRPRISFAKARQLWSFSNWLLISRIGSFLSRKSDQFLIGGIVGATALGGYHVGGELATMPTAELVMPMRRALFPTLSKLQGDPTAFRGAVLQSFSTLAILCVSMGFGLMITAGEIVPLLLGAQWHSAIPLVRWLALYGTFSALALVLEVPIWVNGRTQVSAILAWLELVLLVPLIVYSVHHYGIEAAAMSRAAVSVVMLPLMLYLASRVCPIRMRDLTAAVWRPLAAGAFMVGGMMLPWEYSTVLWIALVTKIALGTVLYLVGLVALWLLSGRPPGIEAAMIRRLRFSSKRALP
jgi:O-antigen/teichoic acid export membrane protein